MEDITRVEGGLAQVTRPMTDDEKLHAFRQQIDACIQKAKYFKGGDRSQEVDPTQSNISSKAGREMSLVYTHLQEAKMWVGQCLGMIGSELPKQYQDKAE